MVDAPARPQDRRREQAVRQGVPRRRPRGRAGEGVVLGLTGQFWRLRGNLDPPGPRTAEDFLAYERPDVCKAVIDLRVGASSLSTETRVRVADPAARRKFRRYWLVIRPFSGLIRIVLLRAARARAEAAA